MRSDRSLRATKPFLWKCLSDSLSHLVPKLVYRSIMLLCIYHLEGNKRFSSCLNTVRFLMCIFNRLTVGWAWSEFFTEAIGILVPADNSSRVGLLIIAKSVFAIFAFVVGRYAEQCLHQSPKGDAKKEKSQLSREGQLSSPLL